MKKVWVLVGVLVLVLILPLSARAGDLSCTMSAGEKTAQQAKAKTAILAHVVGIDELEKGYRLWLPKNEINLRALADYVAMESTCCVFFDFRIGVEHGSDRVSLSVTGPGGAKRMLKSALHGVSFDVPVTDMSRVPPNGKETP